MNNIDKLMELLDQSSFKDSIKKRTAELLLEAINDWPVETAEIEDFIVAVEKKINGEISIKKIDLALKRLDVLNEVWIVESLTSVREIFHLNDEKNFRQIVAGLF
jgi:hypothetical protein